ncbi:hypothetical protein C5167_041966 [Papaver somniferum]|nr:hypothetical protein C5167_041966 [Papaver somniferum]
MLSLLSYKSCFGYFDKIYTWIGCNSAKFGHLYAAAPTRPSNTMSVTSILGGASDNTGSSIARRLGISYIFEVGLIVGKGGETIKSLQTRSGAIACDASLISKTVGDDEYWSGIAQGDGEYSDADAQELAESPDAEYSDEDA